jgi:MoxR-like ATPase
MRRESQTVPWTSEEIDGKTHEVSAGVARLIENIKSVIFIDSRKLEHIVAAKIAGGHVILADSHGVGKTSLARALAGSISWARGDLVSDNHVEVDMFNRIQCTVDLLPQDILGYNRFLGASQDIVFNKGPIFAHFVLCDEINLLTPKTQGSFLQAMEEQSVTIEGRTYTLPDPFFIIATMNLKGIHLFPLPAPQLDRFMIQLSLGYPSAEDESEIIKKHGRDDAWSRFRPVIESKHLAEWKSLVDRVDIHQDVVDYIVSCVRATRNHPDVSTGASPRTGVKVSRMVRSLALIRGQNYVTIDLVKEVFPTTVTHRLIMRDPSLSAEPVVRSIMETVPADFSRGAK